MTFHRGWSEECGQGVGVLGIHALDEYDEEEEGWEDDLDEEWEEESDDWEEDEDSDDWDDEEDEDWEELGDEEDDDFEARRGGRLDWN